MNLTNVEALNQAWNRLENWLITNVPDEYATLRPPADPENISAIKVEYGFPLHPELKALLEYHDGVHHDPSIGGIGSFLPGHYRLIDAARIAGERSMLLQFSDDFPEIWGEWPDDAVVAHAHQWVTFAQRNDGGIAFVDHRPGSTYGHVYEFGMGSGASDVDEWATSPTDFFDAIANSLKTGRQFKRYHPTIHESSPNGRRLSWRQIRSTA
jgi:cell wall assembly regulator SMI1